MADNVISLDGGPLPGQADGDLIEMLSMYLEQAMRGEITGIAIAIARPNGRTGSAFFYGSSGHTLTAAVCGLFYDVNVYTRECSREETLEPRPGA